MSEAREYVLGQSASAAHRLAIQDAHFGDVSEKLLDELALRPNDRVVELGCGPGGFSRRVLRRLGPGGVLVGVDLTEGLLSQARTALASLGPARFEAVLADVSALGSWLDGADVVLGRAVLHHVPMAEFLLGGCEPPCVRERTSDSSNRTSALLWLALRNWKPADEPSCRPCTSGPSRSTSYTWLAASPRQSARPWPGLSRSEVISRCVRAGRNANRIAA